MSPESRDSIGINSWWNDKLGARKEKYCDFFKFVEDGQERRVQEHQSWQELYGWDVGYDNYFGKEFRLVLYDTYETVCVTHKQWLEYI